MRRLLFVLIVAAFGALAPAYQFAWWNHYDGPSDGLDQGWESRIDNNSNTVYTVGTSDNNFGNIGTVLLKYNQAGTFLWPLRFDRSDGNIVDPYIDIDPQGNIYLTCSIVTGGGNFHQVAVMKIDPNGNKLWERDFNAPGDLTDDARGIVVDQFGNSFVMTQSFSSYVFSGGSATTANIYVASYDTNGVKRWDDTYRSFYSGDNTRQQQDWPISIKLDLNNDVIVCGYTEIYLVSDTDLVTYKLANAGGRVWTNTYFGPGGFFAGLPLQVTTDPVGNVIVAGRVLFSQTGDSDILTVKFDKNGNWVWTRSFDGGIHNYDQGNDVTTDSVGNVYVAGEASLTAGHGTDAVVLRYDPSGNALPFLFYSQGIGPVNETFTCVRVDAAGNVQAGGVIGFSGDNIQYFGWIRFFPGGGLSFFRYNSPAHGDVCRDLRIAANGDVYLTGSYGNDTVTMRMVQEPVANNDSLTTSEDTAIVQAAPGIMSNDFFYQGGIASIVSNPGHGSLSLSQNGAFTYTPQTNFFGTDTFTYQITKNGMTSLNATVTINVLALLSSVACSPSKVPGGANSSCTINLSGPAPTGGATIQLSSNTPNVAQIPSSIFIGVGKTSGVVKVTTGEPSSDVTVTITASRNSVTKTCTLVVTPVQIIAFTITPSTVIGGTSATGKVTISGPANGSQNVTISENSSVLTTPTSVIIPSGATSATFTIGTAVVGAPAVRPITVSLNGSSKTAYITLNPSPKLSAFTIVPSTIKSGNNATGTVTLASAAPSGGAPVTLKSGSAAISVPASVTVAAGATTATFVVKTYKVSFTAVRYVSASAGGVTKTVAVTLTP